MKVALELDTRSKLLKAAVEVFSKEGFASSSVRQIADLAGVNHGSIKYHYSSKTELWRATVKYLFQRMEAAVFENEAQWKKMSPREQLVDHIETFLRFNVNNPAYLRIVMFETISPSERYEWLAENYLRPFAARAINRTALAQEDGLFRADIPPLNLYHMNIAASRSMILAGPELFSQYGVDICSEIEIQRHADAMVKMFVVDEKESVSG